jgi:hypothetical protein
MPPVDPGCRSNLGHPAIGASDPVSVATKHSDCSMLIQPHHVGTVVVFALLCLGCGNNSSPSLRDQGVQRPPPQLYAKYTDFYLISQDKGASYDYILVSRKACMAGLFSVEFPELGDVNFRDFDDRLKDIMSISKCKLKNGDGSCYYSNVTIEIANSKVDHVFIKEHRGASLKDEVVCSYRTQPIVLPLEAAAMNSLFGKPKQIDGVVPKYSE